MNRVRIRNGRNPFEFALVSVCAATGGVGLMTPAPGPSNSILETFGPIGSQWFYLAMTVSAIVALGGMLWRRTTIAQLSVGMRVEQVGLLPLGGACAAYATANILLNGVPALVAGMLVAGIAVACWIRARIISVDLKQVDALIRLDISRPTEGGDR